MRVQVRVRDEKFQAVDDAAVTGNRGRWCLPAPRARRARRSSFEAEPALSEPGLYFVTYVPRQTGGFKAVATVKNQGADLGRAETGWSTDLAAEEFRSLTPNVALLSGDIARKTGRQVVAAEDLEIPGPPARVEGARDGDMGRIPRGTRR